MHRLPRAAMLLLAAALTAAPLAGRAQKPPQPADAAPATAPATAPAPAPQGAPDPSNPANKMLQVATVKLTAGLRASKLIGETVSNEQGQQVGSIDDLILGRDDKVMVAVVSVGGFLGIGSKLVAIPWDKLQIGKDDKLTLPGASKEALNAMPAFTF